MRFVQIVLAFLRRRAVKTVLSLGLTLMLGALLIATIQFTLFDLQWLAFLGGILFAAVLAMASQASKAEWLVVRRTRQLERMREQLAQEITRNRTAGESQRIAETRLRLVSDNLPISVFYVDRDLRCRYHNKAARELSGQPDDKIDGQPLRDVVRAAHLLMLPHFEQTLAGMSVDYELVWPGKGGAAGRYKVRQVPYTPEGEQPIGFYIMLVRTTAEPVVAPPPVDIAPPAETAAETGVTATVTSGFTVSVENPLLDQSATLVAFTVTTVGPLSVAGAVYNPLAEIEPTAGFKLHPTPRFVVPLTIALSCKLCPVLTTADPGITVTPADGLTIIVAKAVLVGSKTLRAVTAITVNELTAAGAVYKPFADIIPSAGARLHVTPCWPVPLTTTVN